MRTIPIIGSWLVAAGVITTLGLLALGFDATVPNLGLDGFIGHPLWGIAVGIVYTKLRDFGSPKKLETGLGANGQRISVGSLWIRSSQKDAES